jgi:hypothetical protein
MREAARIPNLEARLCLKIYLLIEKLVKMRKYFVVFTGFHDPVILSVKVSMSIKTLRILEEALSARIICYPLNFSIRF